MPTSAANPEATHCASCLQPLPPGVSRCPSCGFINDRPAPDSGRTKRWRILWRTFAVHPGDPRGFVTIQGHYLYTGVTVTLSKGRWVATNVIGIIAMGVISLALSALAVLARAPLFFIVLLGLAAAFVFQVYLLLWSLKPNLPPR